jgi:hypothetical protein
MQAIELKRGLPISNLRTALAVFLETRYHRSPSDFEADLNALEGLRTDVVLVQLGSKFPFDEEHVPCQYLILVLNGHGRSK